MDLKNSIKKILITHSSNDNYGASKILISIVDIFIKNGYDIYLILPSNGPMNDNQIIKKTNLKILNLGVFRKKYFTFFGLINRFYFIIKSSLYIKNFLKRNQIDLVYTNTSTLISPSIAAKFTGIPSYFHIHEIPNGNPIYARFITAFVNVFSREIICVSKSVYEFWIKNGLKKSKTKIIYNGFKIKKSKSKILTNDKIVFTSIARIIPYKGHSLLIRIFDMLCKKNKNIYLQIVGDTLPQYQKYLDELNLDVKRRGLNNKIKFLGFRENVLSILDKSNFFIHTPLSPDPLPTVILEAINSKTPVITNNLGGGYEILNEGKNGLIIKNDLIEESVEKVLSYLDNKKQQQINIENAFNYVCENFSFEKYKSKIINTIEEKI
jgi:glycosyltransferase involved in cell wall biosynthesis